MAVRDFPVAIARALLDVIQPLRDALASPDAFSALMVRHGWQPPSDPAYLPRVQAIFNLTSTIENVNRLLEDVELTEDASVATVEAAVDAAVRIIAQVRALTSLPAPADLPFPLNQAGFWQAFPADVLQDRFARYLELSRPSFFAPLHLLGIVDERFVPAEGVPGRLDYTRTEIRWERLAELITDPRALARQTYGWGGTFDHEKFLRRMERVLQAFRLPARRQFAQNDLLSLLYSPTNPALGAVRELRAPMLFEKLDTAGFLQLGLALLPIPPAASPGAPPSGFLVGPYAFGRVPAEIELGGPFLLRLRGGLDANQPIGILIRPEGISVRLTTAGTTVDAAVELEARLNSPLIIAGSEDSHHLQVTDATLALGVQGPIADPELTLSLSTGKLELILDFSEGDSFLNRIFGSEPQRFEVSAGLIFSSRTGLSLRGSTGLRLSVPLNVTVGTARLFDLVLNLSSTDSGLSLSAAVSGSATLGPVVATVQDVGFELSLIPRAPGRGAGTFGDLDLRFGFKPPTGAGLSVDAGAVAGGGFLLFDRERDQYAGAMVLEFARTINLNAIGLITTRLPDGSRGFSLLVIITARDLQPPIPLGFGFFLTGAGGLFGLNRTALVEVLRAGIKNHTLDSILFPPNLIANAPQIISNLNAVFPPAEGHHLFGPIGRIEWGTPTVLSIDIGVVLEFPAPLRLLILGQVRALVPVARPLIRLQLDAFGMIDFDRRTLALDLTLFDSEITGFPITGDAAVRLDWGANPNFLLAVGGFNPRFQAPPGFPALNRLTVNLGQGNNPRLRLEGYMAITSQTFQIGGNLDLYAEAGPLSVQAYLGMDALIHFSPFGFAVDIRAGVAIKFEDFDLFGVRLAFTLMGPAPWRARGKATIEILFLDVDVGFDFEWGSRERPPLPEPVNVLGLLLAALRGDRNWESSLPGDGHQLVTFRPVTRTEEIVVHPLGEFTVRQRVVPLDLPVQRFGNATVTGPAFFRITRVEIGEPPAPAPLSTVQDFFARGQFQELTDEQRLATRSFEQLDSGVRAALGRIEHGMDVPVAFSYKEIVLDPSRRAPRLERRYLMPVATFTALISTGAAANSPLDQTGSVKFRGPSLGIDLRETRYVVATTDTLQIAPVPGLAGAGSFSAATAALGQFLATHPEQRERLQIVPRQEGVTA